jgi:uncharacterized protein YhjY with autotransporter beta-barrel domain
LPDYTGRWGGSINATYDWGHRQATDDENGLHSGASEFTVGADYRFNRDQVAGAILAFADDDLSFNEASNIVGGSLDTKGYSLLIFAQQFVQQAQNGLFVSEAAGDQFISQHMTRTGTFIDPYTDYQSPFAATSSTKGQSLLGSLTVGYDKYIQALMIEPSVDLKYRRTHIDGFQEQGAQGQENNATELKWNINLRFDSQSVTSLQATATLKVQYALSSSFGSLTPFLDVGITHECNDSVFNVTGNFVALYGQSMNGQVVPNFVLLADKPDPNFGTVAGGFVFFATGRLQGAFQYRQVFGQRYITDHAVALSIRIAL